MKDLYHYLNLPQVKQRTPEWDKIREKLITATNVSSILEFNTYLSKYDIFHQKISNKCTQMLADEQGKMLVDPKNLVLPSIQ